MIMITDSIGFFLSLPLHIYDNVQCAMCSCAPVVCPSNTDRAKCEVSSSMRAKCERFDRRRSHADLTLQSGGLQKQWTIGALGANIPRQLTCP